jgi:hypothetical protein
VKSHDFIKITLESAGRKGRIFAEWRAVSQLIQNQQKGEEIEKQSQEPESELVGKTEVNVSKQRKGEGNSD